MEPVPKDIDSYIDLQPGNVRSKLLAIRSAIKEAVPEADEVISYRMPAFRYHEVLVWFASFKKHYTIFFPNKTLKNFSEELKSFELIKSGAGIKFSHNDPVPEDLLKKILKARKEEILQKRK
jgi:uncharacterized protein YdhG (YjbR/CyaY superfamily)